MVIRHGGLTAAERVKKAAEVCKQECSPYCPYWTEDECHKHMMEDCAEAIAERDERIAIMQESMETLEKRCNALEALEKRLKDPDRINVTHCKDCKHLFDGEQTENCCDVLMEKTGWMHEISVSPDWYCADGETR